MRTPEEELRELPRVTPSARLDARIESMLRVAANRPRPWFRRPVTFLGILAACATGLFLLGILGRPVLAASTPELAGFFVLTDKASFVLIDPASGERSSWLSVGGSFAGYRIAEFQREEGIVVLERNGERFSVPLRDAIIQDQRIAFSGDIAIGSGEVVKVSQGVLRFGEETAYPVTDEITLYIEASRTADGNIIYKCRFERTKDDGTIELLSAPRIKNRPDLPFSMVMGDLSLTLQPSSAPVR